MPKTVTSSVGFYERHIRWVEVIHHNTDDVETVVAIAESKKDTSDYLEFVEETGTVRVEFEGGAIEEF